MPQEFNDGTQITKTSSTFALYFQSLCIFSSKKLNYFICIFRLQDSTPEVDRHPEKRMKAAFEDFEKVRLPELKAENPSLRLSQLKQMLRKEWQKHPNNPVNKQLADLAKGGQ